MKMCHRFRTSQTPLFLGFGLMFGMTVACAHVADDTAELEAFQQLEEEYAPIAGQDVLENIEGPFTWGLNTSVSRFHRHYIAGDLAPDAIEKMVAEKIALVIDLRESSEFSWDEKTAVTDAGIKYVHVPIDPTRSFNREAFDTIESINQSQVGNILIHCSSGNRAAAWLATHLVRVHNYDVTKALTVARELGMTSDAAEQKAWSFMQEHPERPGESMY